GVHRTNHGVAGGRGHHGIGIRPVADAFHELPDDRHHVLAAVRLIGAAHDLHVLLRHRLLHQPHGFEGFMAVEEDADATDLALNEVVHVRAFSTGHHPAAATSRSEACTRDRIADADSLHALHLLPLVR